jgi:hypothetical protein
MTYQLDAIRFKNQADRADSTDSILQIFPGGVWNIAGCWGAWCFSAFSPFIYSFFRKNMENAVRSVRLATNPCGFIINGGQQAPFSSCPLLSALSALRSILFGPRKQGALVRVPVFHA